MSKLEKGMDDVRLGYFNKEGPASVRICLSTKIAPYRPRIGDRESLYLTSGYLRGFETGHRAGAVAYMERQYGVRGIDQSARQILLKTAEILSIMTRQFNVAEYGNNKRFITSEWTEENEEPISIPSPALQLIAHFRGMNLFSAILIGRYGGIHAVIGMIGAAAYPLVMWTVGDDCPTFEKLCADVRAEMEEKRRREEALKRWAPREMLLRIRHVAAFFISAIIGFIIFALMHATGWSDGHASVAGLGAIVLCIPLFGRTIKVGALSVYKRLRADLPPEVRAEVEETLHVEMKLAAEI
jgi:hypothetical protein